MDLLSFQRRFIKNVLRPGIRTACLSLPRGNGKTTLTAWLASRILDPNDELFTDGKESHIVAASLGQAQRTLFKQLRTFLKNPNDYKIADSANNVAYVMHKKTGTKISLLTASYRSAQGIVDCPWIFADEPAAWQTLGGSAMHTAIRTAQGKPGSRLKTVYIGTRSPADSDSWWIQLLDKGSHGSTFVYDLQGAPSKWTDKRELRRVNPLMYRYPESRVVLVEELNEAKKNSRLKADFLSFRMNVPSQDESTVLLTVEDWKRILARTVPPRDSLCAVGIDAAAGRAWNAAVACWKSGRVEARAICPGVPSVAEQEKRDRVASGTYQRLIDAGILHVSHGRRVPLMSALIEVTRDWKPKAYVCDSFRQAEVLDAVNGKTQVIKRRTLWSEASEDIRNTRRLCLDGNIAIDPVSRPLLEHSMSVSRVENDTSGNSRLVKAKSDGSARDDVVSAFVLAAGTMANAKEPKKVKYAVA